MLNKEEMLADVASEIGIDLAELRMDVPLEDQGLDSLRLVTLVEQWRARGHEVDFFRVLGLSTLAEWEKELL